MKRALGIFLISFGVGVSISVLATHNIHSVTIGLVVTCAGWMIEGETK